MTKYKLYIHSDFVEEITHVDMLMSAQSGLFKDLTHTDWGYFSDNGVCKFKEIV